MTDAQAESHYSWRQLDAEWYRARGSWRDSTAEYFEAQIWEPLRSDTLTYLRALDELIETLRAAHEVARGR